MKLTQNQIRTELVKIFNTSLAEGKRIRTHADTEAAYYALVQRLSLFIDMLED